MAIIGRSSCPVTPSLFDGKRCSTCGGWFPISSFTPDPRYRDGLRTQCKPCAKGKGLPGVCRACGKSYTKNARSNKSCSRECAITLIKHKPGPRVPCTCIKCGADFLFLRSRRHCPNCVPRNMTHSVCQWCSVDILANKKKVFCSSKCYGYAKVVRQKGEKSHLWQGGKSSATAIFRESAEYKAWRTAVFERDDFTCQICNQRGGRLTAHHIKQFALFPDLQLVIANGITLCWPCHTPLRKREAEYEERFFAITGGIPE
jgi:hypothetical protein